MDRNDPQFLKMAIKSDLMRVAQSAGRLTNPESYDVWMTFLNKALENMQKLESNERIQKLRNYLVALILPKEKVLYDLKSRLKWAERVLDIACML
jgi:hypothetical protein